MPEVTNSTAPTTPAAPQATQAPQAAPETKTPEAPKPEGEAVQQPSDKIAPRFAALAREERRIQREKDAFKAEREADKKTRESEAQELEQLRAKVTILEEVKKSPRAVLRILDEAGLTFDDLTKAILDEPESKPSKEVSQLVQDVQALQKKLSDRDSAEEKAKLEQTQTFIDNQISEFKAQAEEVIKADPDRFELILANDAFSEVFSVVEKYWEETGEILDPEVAADYLEKELTEKAKSLLSAKKLASGVLAPEKKGESVQETKPGRETKPPSKTLSNDALPAGGDIPLSVSRAQKIKQAADMLVYKT